MTVRELSPRAKELVRLGARRALDSAADLIQEVDAATMSAVNHDGVMDDPVLVAGIRRANQANTARWAEHNIRHPGTTPAPALTAETLDIVRDLVRRGLNEFSFDAYRAGQNAAWSAWMAIIFDLTRDPDELREILEVTAASIATFVDSTIAGIAAQIRHEREQLTVDIQGERRELIALVLTGAPIAVEQASRRLDHPLAGDHVAAVVWSDEPGADRGSLERVAERLAKATGGHRPLTMAASAGSIWVWISLHDGDVLSLDAARLHQIRDPGSGIQIAVGSQGHGVEGFRRSHLDALTTQRTLAGSPESVATFASIELIALLGESENARAFVLNTLGALATADRELRDCLRTYLRRRCNVAATAAELFVHRNTLLRRLNRAEDLLPRPLDENPTEVAVALESVRWSPEVRS